MANIIKPPRNTTESEPLAQVSHAKPLDADGRVAGGGWGPQSLGHCCVHAASDRGPVKTGFCTILTEN